MLFVRVLTAAIRPALLSGTLAATAAGGYFAYNHFHDDVTPFQQVQDQGQQLLISEFGEFTDTIVSVEPDDVSQRTVLATVDHAPGYGIFATLAPDGRAIAYTALPAELREPSPDLPAQAAIIDVNGHVSLLAGDVDLLVPPVWSPDSQSIVVRKNTPSADSAGSFELLLLGRDGSRTELTRWTTAAVFPVGFTLDGSVLYFATLNEDGSDLYSIAPDGSGETLVAHLTDEIARDWKLSPDGASVAYSIAESGEHPRMVTMRLDIAAGALTEALPDGTGLEFNPAWRGSDELTVAEVKQDGGGDAVSVATAGAKRALTQNDDTIDLPLTWSPDGETLAVRSVEGAQPYEASESHVELVAPDGTRDRVSDNADVLIVGWLQ